MTDDMLRTLIWTRHLRFTGVYKDKTHKWKAVWASPEYVVHADLNLPRVVTRGKAVRRALEVLAA